MQNLKIDRSLNNVVFVRKTYHINYLIKELCIDNSLGNLIYTPRTYTKEVILYNNKSVLCSKLIEVLIDNVFAIFDRRVYQKTIGMAVGINCVP